MIANGERQVATTLDGIRADHRNRYEWAAERLAGKRVYDAACGVGYGSAILAEAGCEVNGFDRDEQTIEFARQNWNHRPGVHYTVADLYTVGSDAEADAVVCFEALEHLADPGTALRNFRSMAPTLIASVPDEDGFPFRGYRHHVRHYTRDEFGELLRSNGWEVREWWGQEDATSPVVKDLAGGRTTIAVCERVDVETPADSGIATPEEILGGPVPESVAIVAMGGSRQVYIDEMIQGWGKPLADEVWAINAMGGLIQWDRMFHMDDVKIQESRVAGGNEKLGAMLDWIRKSTRPVYTSRAYEDYPALREYPLEWVLNRVGHGYMNNTVAYPIALAVALGVKRIAIYGADYTYPNVHKREKGRACVEFWLGVAAARGIEINVPDASTLLDANQPQHERLYGYDTEWVTIQQAGDRIKVHRVARLPEDVPSASDIELRYSHDPRKDQATPTKE